MTATEGPPCPRNSEPSAGGSFLVNFLCALGRRKKRIALVVLIAGVAAAAWSFITPSIYEANTKILMPERVPSVTTMLAGSSLAGLAGASNQSLMSALRNPTDLYVSMLQSRTMLDAIITRFKLMEVYKCKLWIVCREKLQSATIITTQKGNIISISVSDKSPERAADLANGYVDELGKMERQYSAAEAGKRSAFFEAQLAQENDALAQAENAMVNAQKSSKLISPEGQTNLALMGIGQLRQEIAAQEVLLRRSKLYMSEQNPMLIQLQATLSALNEQLNRAESQGVRKDSIIPAAGLPDAGLDYLRHARAIKYHESIVEVLLRQYEAARLDEARAGVNIQVLDKALAPELRARPKRRLIVAIACAAALFLSVLFCLAQIVLDEALARPEMRQHLSHLREAWGGTNFLSRKRRRNASEISTL